MAESNTQFEIPFDVIELPSKGLLYPGADNTCKVQYMTASDENILTSPNLIKNGKALDVLLERKIVDSPIPVKDFLIGDRNAIMIWLRATGYGEMYPVKLVDPNTGEEFEYEVDLNDLKTKPLTAEPDENGYFDFELPKSKKKIKFKLLTVNDEASILKRSEARSKAIKSQISNTLTYRLEQQIVSVDGNADKNYISQFIQYMPAYDSLKFREYCDEIEPGIDMTLDVEGPSGETFPSTIPIGLDFFWPNARV
tara:strand:- start:3153 stop:3911 length:759 start_codon:yes stop_codon:yes gene_type:complete